MGGGPPAFDQGSTCLGLLRIPLAPIRISGTGLSPSSARLPRRFPYPIGHLLWSIPRNARAPVWALPISLAATLGIDVSFSSSGYLDVSVHRVPLHTLWIYAWMTEVPSAGFPHSDICGSLAVCASPQLFAAYHVFLRLSVPRHPPYALVCWPFLPSRAPRSGPGHVASCPSMAFLVSRFYLRHSSFWTYGVFILGCLDC